jgi:hypothetical protein
VNEAARKEMLVRWCEAFSRALLVHCRCGSGGDLQMMVKYFYINHDVHITVSRALLVRCS